jgi:hypothetical protein
MSSLRQPLFLILLAMVIAALGVPRAQAQAPPVATYPTMPGPPPPFGDLSSDKDAGAMATKMARERNVLRQKAIVDETNQLLDLAKQLKEAVDKSDKDELSLDVIRKAEQIEKLSRDVKAKMRDGTADPTSEPWNSANAPAR